ncbi:MAG TPA: MBL fold metallo-hydrolase [Pseudolabrys sp.]|nr:MBL fold metallo-hydrolase [Pseudolabrys sp.]
MASMRVRFWGVRGSIPCPGPDTIRYGGNTPCVEIRCGDRVLIFDAGTGIRALGHALIGAGMAADTDIFFSHCHLDHVIGLPFYAPLFSAGNRVHLWAGHLEDTPGVEDAVRKVMSFPLFPIEVETFRAHLEFHDFRAGESLKPRPGIEVKTMPLSHPGGATGYRVEFEGRSAAYLTDIELGDGPFDEGAMVLAQDAGALIVDSTYTDKEMPEHRGWGHSSWQQVVRFANKARVGKLCLFHHDPDHDDAFMDAMAAAADEVRPGTLVAREGLAVDL